MTNFGALGDGRSDDSHIIQRCVDAAAAVGVPVLVPREVFRTTVSITIFHTYMLVRVLESYTRILSTVSQHC